MFLKSLRVWISPDLCPEIKHCGFPTQNHLCCFNPYFALLWVWSMISTCSELQGNASLLSLSKIVPSPWKSYHFVGSMEKKIKSIRYDLNSLLFGNINGWGIINLEESAEVQCRGQGMGEQKRTSAEYSYCFKKKGATSLAEFLAWVMVGELRRSWFVTGICTSLKKNLIGNALKQGLRTERKNSQWTINANNEIPQFSFQYEILNDFRVVLIPIPGHDAQALPFFFGYYCTVD